VKDVISGSEGSGEIIKSLDNSMDYICPRIIEIIENQEILSRMSDEVFVSYV
jgi:hypothetical protein